jgi:putative addiction module killer protein
MSSNMVASPEKEARQSAPRTGANSISAAPEYPITAADGFLARTRSLGQGLHELKIDYGPGYRIYFGRLGDDIVILLCGGDKSSQNADIRNARLYWADYKLEKRYAHD